MQRRVTVRAIIMRDNKLFCVRHKDYENNISKDFWCLPGGGLDPGEALVDGIHREMVEETGVAPEVGNVLYVQQFTRGDKEYLEFFFHVTNAEDYLNINLSETSHGGIEIAEFDFIDPKGARILPEFLATEPLDEVISHPAPVKLFVEK